MAIHNLDSCVEDVQSHGQTPRFTEKARNLAAGRGTSTFSKIGDLSQPSLECAPCELRSRLMRFMLIKINIWALSLTISLFETMARIGRN